MAAMGNDSFLAEGTAPPLRMLFPPEKICLDWQERRGAGAGLHNLGNTCFLNSVLQCLTYTPPLATYLLSGEHSRSCRQPGFCMMCIMEEHVTEVLCSSDSAIQPWAVVNALPHIGGNFQLGMQDDAHEFLCYALHAMQTACLSGSSHLDMSSQATTIIHQIFEGFLRSRVTCLRCQGVSDSYEAFLDLSLDIKAAPSLTVALRHFLKPERLDGFNCSKCHKTVAATKKFTIHGAPKVLTVCLSRCDDFTGRKITKMVEYPEYLDLQPYASQASGEPLLYTLYAVLVHSGGSCDEGHFFCYTKASNGDWYRMNDASVAARHIDTVLQQQAYLLFYVRCSDVKSAEQRASPSAAPSYAQSSRHQRGARVKQACSVGPRSLPRRTEDTAVGREGSPEDSSSAPAPWAAWEQTPLRERERSRSPRRDWDLHSHLLEMADPHCSARRTRSWRRSPPRHDQDQRDDAAPGPSNASSKQAPAPWAAREQTPLRQRERSRSPPRHWDLCRSGLCTTAHGPSAGRKKRRVAAPQRRTSGKHSGRIGGGRGRLQPWVRAKLGT